MSNLETTSTNRLPRYTCVATHVECVLTQRDLTILQAVESFRLLTSEHITALTHGSDQGILRRLHKLYHAGYLDRPRQRRVNGGGSARMVYAITNKGLQTLQKAGLIQNPPKTDWNAKNRDLHDFSIDHRLLVSHIRATFLLACQATYNSGPQATQAVACQRNPGIQFLFWREGREIQDTIEVALPDKYARLPVAPDGFFALQDAKGRTNFFVEADRGTMPIKRFTLKLKAYAAYRRQKKHTEKFGIQHFRVLTVTSSAARCKNLVKAAEAADDVRKDGRLFLFATEKDLPLSSPESVHDKIWTAPGRGDPCSIL